MGDYKRAVLFAILIAPWTLILMYLATLLDGLVP